MSTKLKDIEVQGQKFEIFIRSDGQFFANIKGEQESASSLDALQDKILRLVRTKAAKIEVPFTYLDGIKLKREVATGIHSGNRNVLTKGGQWRGYNEDAMRDLTPAEESKLTKLLKRQAEIENAIIALKEKYAIDLRAVVEEAIAAAIGYRKAE